MKQETLEEVCDKVLNYLYPNCKKEMSNLQYTNSINSLKSIAKWQQEPEQFFNDDRVKTLEKASKRAVKSGLFKDETLFIAGAKFQQEQDKNKFSEEEVLEQLNILMSLPSSTLDKFTDDNGNITIKWFEQFKKK
jgi:hypothetical protein